LTQQH
jgi:chromosome segregation ATPase